jgi:pyridoxamine 5'-phosphate oxidase
MNLADIRKEYILKSLELEKVADSPISQFHTWLNEALIAEVMEVNAMDIATINSQNRPSSRMVLLKGVDHGFIFYTNYKSKKGEELAKVPFAALNFFWPELERQVRIEGEVEKTTPEASDEYFLSRPITSQIGAWSSPQSKAIPDRAFLVEREKEMVKKFNNEPLKRPEYWGGYRVIPYYMEFWQGGASRLHDRIAFEKKETGGWTKKRLAP